MQVRLLVWSGGALLIALVYAYTDWFDGMKSKVVDFAAPFYWVSDLPARTEEWAGDRVASRTRLSQDNSALRSENLILRQKMQQNAALAAENYRLRQLMNASETIEDKVLIAELIGVSPDPQIHKVVINRGKEHGVYEGQAVLDASGLMGQVVEVGQSNSFVLLITDSTHALPVQINRNGVRLVAEGIGDLYKLNIRHVANTIDIQVGDLLVSSGLGQRFPFGYPVAEVTEVSISQERAFARVSARPMAKLNRSRRVLLVFDRE
ncbi:MAG: rod shape-determining protein MreC [Flavobacteriales bacterium]|jgi:rod shape-determining protein MreC